MAEILEYQQREPAFRREGMWWRTMGVTRTHRWGVFLTQGVFCTAGMVVGAAAWIVPGETGVRLLISAASLFLLAGVTVLASILSLLFYMVDRR